MTSSPSSTRTPPSTCGSTPPAPPPPVRPGGSAPPGAARAAPRSAAGPPGPWPPPGSSCAAARVTKPSMVWREGPLPGRDGPLGQRQRGVGDLARRAARRPAPRRPVRSTARSASAFRSSGLASTVPGETEELVLGLLQSHRRGRPRISWARTACRSSAAAKVRPPAHRIAAASATMSTAVVGDLAVQQAVDQLAARLLRGTRVGDRATQRRPSSRARRPPRTGHRAG